MTSDPTVLVSAVETPFGLFLAASEDGYYFAADGPVKKRTGALEWGRWRFPHRAVELAREQHHLLRSQLCAYFEGRLKKFELPLRYDGIDLHVRAWQAAILIPYAMTMTYGDLAWECAVPGAARAMGRAMTVCTLPLLVPCHRVVGAGGRVRGSDESCRIRSELLQFERDQLS